MFRLIPFVLILQIFCLYLAYKNNADQKWYWFIIVFPVLGCPFYLYHLFYKRENIDKVSETLKTVVNSNHKIEQLELEVKHNDSFINKENLADEYFKVQRYKDAIKLYNSCLSGINKNDPGILTKLVEVLFLDKNYQEAVIQGKLLENDRKFENSNERVYYAWALYPTGQEKLATIEFEDLDISYANYSQRIEYCKFLNQIEKKEEALEKLTELYEEYNRMNSQEKKLYRGLGSLIKKVGYEINKPF